MEDVNLDGGANPAKEKDPGIFSLLTYHNILLKGPFIPTFFSGNKA